MCSFMSGLSLLYVKIHLILSFFGDLVMLPVADERRCTRNCFNCPTCTAPMSVSPLDTESSGGAVGPWILACEYCRWTTLDIGIKFDKPTNIYGQLSKTRKRNPVDILQESNETKAESEVPLGRDPDATFASLKAFYSTQLSKANASNPLSSPGGDFNYNSPSSLARIMSLYTDAGSYGKKAAAKESQMRESADAAEGLHLVDQRADERAIDKLHTHGWQGTASIAQQADQSHPTRFIADLRPVPTLLRTKRSKRCRTCKHILVKPEAKVQNTRFKIKLVARNYVPRMQLQPLQSPAGPFLDITALPPRKPAQFLLSLTNPMFEPVKVTLATPSRTPGRFPSKVTILCPQFEIGPNVDVWDDALDGGGGKAGRGLKMGAGGEPDGKVAEAGKVWERKRNRTTVVVEIVPAKIDVKDYELDEDEALLEIPIFARIEYEADVDKNGDCGGINEKDRREQLELAYWCVLGVGEIGWS